MLKRLKAFFKPPIFPDDEEKSRKAVYASSISLAFSGAVLAFELFLRFTREVQAFVLADFILIGLAVTGALSWWLVQKGRVLFASIMLVTLIWAGSNGIAASGFGARDPSFINNIVVMLIAALLLGWQASILVAVISAIVGFGLAYAETTGAIVVTYYPILSFAQDFTVILGLSAFFIYILVSGLEKAIRQSRISLVELETTNKELNRAQLDLEARTSDLIVTNQILQKRTSRLRVVAEVARTITAVQTLDQLLPSLTTMIAGELGVYHAGIFLTDDSGQFVTLRSANSDGGLRMIARGYQLKVGEQDSVGIAAQSGKPHLVLAGRQAAFLNNPDLPDTRSKLSLPIKVSGLTIGVLDLQAVEANAFDNEDMSLLTILADQIAIAIQNSRSYENAQRALQEAEFASGQLTGQAWKGYAETIRANGYRYDGIKLEPTRRASRSSEDKDVFTVPVLLRGQAIGRLKLKASDASHQWTEDELAIINSTAERVALAMDGARLLDGAQKRATRETFLSQLTAKLGTSFQLDSILRDTVEELGQTLKGSTVTFHLVNPSAPTNAEVANDATRRKKVE